MKSGAPLTADALPTSAVPLANPSQRLNEAQLEQLAEILDEVLVGVEQGKQPDIASICQQHPELADAIEHYLQSLNLVQRAASELRNSGSSVPVTGVSHKRLGDYRLIREIGRGGMGVVYEAEQLSLSRRVAVKILPFAAVLDARKIARFQHEAQAAASLHHPHIVPVYAVGHDRGTYFYSMQYIDGQSLDFAIAQLRYGHEGSLFGLVGDREQLDIRNATTLCAASQSGDQPARDIALDRGAIQAQLKQRVTTEDQANGNSAARIAEPYAQTEAQPGSGQQERASTIRMDGGESTLPAERSRQHIKSRDYIRRVAELGIQAAQALGHAHQSGIIHRDIKPSNLLLDANGKLWVTDFGLAQCSSLDSLTRSGDIMGTVRYMSPEQASGKTHWIDNRTDIYSLGLTLYELLTLRPVVTGNDHLEVSRQIENSDPVPPRRFNPATPVDLENIILKALARQREDRYATAEDLANDLRRFLDGQTPTARRPSLLDRSARWVSRNARAVAVAGTVALVALVATILVASILGSMNREIAQSRQQAERHLQIANEVVHRFGHGMLTRLELLPGSETLRHEVAQQAIDYFKQFTSYASTSVSMQPDVARALMACADIESQIGDQRAASAHYEEAEQLFNQCIVERPGSCFADWLLCMNNHACTRVRLGQSSEGLSLLKRALDRLASAPANAVTSGNRAGDLSAGNSSAGNWLAIEALLRLNMGTVYANRNDVSLADKQFNVALQLLADSRALDADPDSEDQPMLVSRHQLSALLTTALLQAGQLPRPVGEASETQSLLEQARRLADERRRTNKADLSAVYDRSLCDLALGAEAASRKQWSTAQTRFQQAAASLKRLCELQPATTVFRSEWASASNNLGQVSLEQRNYPAARDAFLESQAALERLMVESDDYRIESNLAGVLNNLAVLEDANGQPQAAIPLLQRAIKLQERAVTRAPDDARCQDFLNEHRAHLARLSGGTIANDSNTNQLRN